MKCTPRAMNASNMPWVTLQFKSGKDGTISPQKTNVKDSEVAWQLPEPCTVLLQRLILKKKSFFSPNFPFFFVTLV